MRNGCRVHLHSARHWVMTFVAVSAEDSPNQAGKVFSFDEFQTLLTSEWTKESGVCLADWLIESFCAKTFLLGALRTEQMNRFRAGGLQSTKMGDGKCEDGKMRPFVISKYKRVKNRNATSPSRLTDEFELVIPCLCDKEHDPIDIEWDSEGNPVGAVNGNVHCWYGLFDYLTNLQDRTQKLIQNFNITERKFSSKQNRSNKKIKKTTTGASCVACFGAPLRTIMQEHRHRPALCKQLLGSKDANQLYQYQDNITRRKDTPESGVDHKRSR